jgi:hypothetical protein
MLGQVTSWVVGKPEIIVKVLINALAVDVGTGTHFSSYPTYNASSISSGWFVIGSVSEQDATDRPRMDAPLAAM